MTRTILALAFAFGALGWATAGRATAQAGGATETLLKASKLDFKKVKDGVFKLIIETRKGIAVVIVEEKKAPWKDNKGADVLYAYIYAEVVRTPADFKPSAAMLTKLAEWNDKIRFGSLGLSKNEDGSYSVFRNATAFLKGMEAEQLADYVIIVHSDKFNFGKELQGFLEGG